MLTPNLQHALSACGWLTKILRDVSVGLQSIQTFLRVAVVAETVGRAVGGGLSVPRVHSVRTPRDGCPRTGDITYPHITAKVGNMIW